MPSTRSAGQFGSGEEIRTWQRRIQDIMDEMRKRSFCDYRASGAWLPTVNIYASKHAYIVCVELAGADRTTLSVECPDPRHLDLSGMRGRPRLDGVDEVCSLELLEIDEGPFHRRIDFGEDVDTTSVEVAYERGFLWVTLQKTGNR
jgi:HSP20 family molecular chaperone IbpA